MAVLQKLVLFCLIWGSIDAATWVATVCCNCDSTGNFTTIEEAQQAIRSIDRGQFDGAKVVISGICQLTTPLSLTGEDSGSDTFPITYSGDGTGKIIGGVAVRRGQAQSTASSNIFKIDFEDVDVQDMGAFHQHTYLGGQACINLYLENITGLELVYWPENTSIRDPSTWMSFARYPDPSVNCNGYSSIKTILLPPLLEVDDTTALRMAAWQEELLYNDDAQAHGFWNGIGWADAARKVTQVFANGLISFAAALTADVEPAAGGYFYTYNLRSELTVPGEMYINRTGRFLEFMPPSALPLPTNSEATIGYLSMVDVLINMSEVSYVSFTNLELAVSRGAGVLINGGSNNTLDSLEIHHVGTMGVNVTDSDESHVKNSMIYAAGSGGINLHGGDRQTLRASNMVAQANEIYEYTRITACYVAGVNLGGVGQQAIGNHVHDADHQAFFAQGNDHAFVSNIVHDVVRSTRDSGAYYMGRDWTYQGIQIVNNTFYNINSWFNRSSSTTNDVQAIYLDDFASGCYIANNTFKNVTTAFVLGGGRSTTFEYNVIDGVGQGRVQTEVQINAVAVPFDNRGMAWGAQSCNASNPDANMVNFLKRVPYNKPPYTKYPHLATILEDEPCVPKYNSISYNSYCNLIGNGSFVDRSNYTIASWNSTNVGNHPLNASCPWLPA